jgi:acetyl-CoA carboxylase biotin carboxyl carrier protein
MSDDRPGTGGGRSGPDDGRGDANRSEAERMADHAAIDRLTDELLPALIAKLGASGLGELEVREGDWRVRLRMPADGPDRAPSRRAGAPVRAGGPGTSSAAPAAPHGAAATPREAEATASGPRGSDAVRSADAHPPRPRAVAVSPAVGVYRPRPGLAVGSRVRTGDRLGVVDVLGVPHDVLAPSDGVVGGSYVEPGDGVEYGQELIRIELASTVTGDARTTAGTPGAAPAPTVDAAPPARAAAAAPASAPDAPAEPAVTPVPGASDPAAAPGASDDTSGGPL